MADMDSPENPREIFDPGTVADRLGLSGAGLRRIAPIYEDVYGPLERDSRDARIWTGEAVERLERARAMVHAGRAGNIRTALLVEESGDEAPYPTPRSASERLSASLLEEIRGLRAAVERQNTLLEEQGKRLEALEAPRDEARMAEDAPEDGSEGSAPGEDTGEPETGEERRSWWDRLLGR